MHVQVHGLRNQLIQKEIKKSSMHEQHHYKLVVHHIIMLVLLIPNDNFK